MIKQLAVSLACLALALAVPACGGGGGGGGSDSLSDPGSPTSAVAKETVTYATVSFDGNMARVDLVNGGAPTTDPTGSLSPNPALRQFLTTVMSFGGADLNANVIDTNGDGIADAGFDSYKPGIVSGSTKATVDNAARIIGANNLYDLFQTTTNAFVLNQNGQRAPVLFQFTNGNPGGPPFTGGDVNADGLLDGGPGLFTNIQTVSGVNSLYPTLPVLPNAMGTPSGTGSGQGPSATDQHQFVQIVFPYKLDKSSLFDFLNSDNSFLGDSAPGATPNVFIEKRWVTRLTPEPDDIQVIDHTFEHANVTGVAIIGGVTAVPFQQGFPTLTTVNVDLSNMPEAAKALVMNNNVFTFIAHEAPASITQTSSPSIGRISADGTLVLPDPTAPTGLGGRVFGANKTIPSSVNDFATDPYDPQNLADLAAQSNRRVGFFAINIKRLRTSQGETLKDPYFHSFPMSQANVGNDPMSVNGSFNRGPAIEVDAVTQIPAIDVLNPSTDYLAPIAFPTSDAVNQVSTKAKFRVNFDKEVVPNSVGFSRQYTIHSVAGKGIVFPYSGNTRPVTSPAGLFVTGTLGSPLAPSVYLAVNQPARVAINNPFRKDANPGGLKDDGLPILPGATPTQQAALNGLYPGQHNTLATLPRGVVPCDIYPVNQNNLQAYVLEPLVQLPAGSVVTLGVCMPGLGVSNNVLPAGYPAITSNIGNFTRNGTKFTPWQGLTPVGLGDPNVAAKQAIIGNATIVKVNSGPMDLQGLLFFGGTGVAIDNQIDGDPNGDNNQTDGGFNVCRTFRVGSSSSQAYVNAPVAPMALYVGYGTGGLGVVDLCGTGFTTNAPGGAQANVGFENFFITSRYLSTAISGNATTVNWSSIGSLANGDHFPAFGITGRYTAGGCSFCTPISFESDLAVGAAIRTGIDTPLPGVNEGSSGYETMVRNSKGDRNLAGNQIGLARDIILGDFLDTVFFDNDNPWAITAAHRTYNAPAEGGVSNNTIADPPFPNPPPMRFPVGLPHTGVIFDQFDLTKDPFIIEGSEVFARDIPMVYNDGTGIPPFTWLQQAAIQLSPTFNQSNTQGFDVPPLPNGGFLSPFTAEFANTVTNKFVQTGPMPETSTSAAVVLSNLNANFGGFDPGGLTAPFYQSRQQIGNFMFVTDGVNKTLLAVNSNTMKVIESLSLPDPYGLGLSPNLSTLYVSNEGDNSLSVVDADPRSATFMTELKRISVGNGPRAVAVSPDNEDVFVLNRIGNTMTIVDVGSSSVRKTISESGINRPNDIALGMREVTGGPAYQSGTFHGFISNGGGDNVLIYEGGPSGVAGIGFDNILGEIRPGEPPDLSSPDFVGMDDPRGMTYDPNAPLDTFSHTVGCFVAHNDPVSGRAVVSRIAYTKDDTPGQTIFNAFAVAPGFGTKVFEVEQQFLSDFTGKGQDVAISDYNRQVFETSDWRSNSNLLNAGASIQGFIGAASQLPRNAKYPLATNQSPAFTNGPRWNPDRVYLLIGSGIIDVFDRTTGIHQKTIQAGGSPTVLTSYFEQ